MRKANVDMDIIENTIATLTDLRRLKWEIMEEKTIRPDDGKIIQCYKTSIKDFTIQTSAKTGTTHSFWRGDRPKTAYGLIVEKHGSKTILTTDSKIIPGIETDSPLFIKWTVTIISDYMLNKVYEKENMPEKNEKKLLAKLEQVINIGRG